MKFMRPDTHIICGEQPVDYSDPEGAKDAIEYAVPDGFCEEAKAMMNYLEGAAFIFSYKGNLVLTDETLELTECRPGKLGIPENLVGGPRVVCPDWNDLECWLTACYEEMESEDSK